MLFLRRKNAPSICPRTGRNLGHNRKRRWLMWMFPITGLLALVWFLIRVLPKPSRAVYPCQRLAFPLACGFVTWILSLAGSVAAFGKARRLLKQSRLGLACLCLTITLVLGVIALVNMPDSPALADEPDRLSPIGEAKGIHPGRVVWVHDPDATDWKGPGNGHWWQSNHTNQAVVDKMMSRAICELTGRPSDTAAWDKLFRHFNKTHGKGNMGYRLGEKITIKVNFVGCIFNEWGGVDPNTYDLVTKKDYMNTSPQMMLALLRQLVNKAKVNQADIAIGDTLAYFPNQYYNLLHKEFPNVRYLDYEGKFGRTSVKQSSVPLYWSCRPKGKLQDYVPVCFVQADYLINLANLKSHAGAAVTLCAKNHYGSLVRWPVQKDYYDLHTDLPSKNPGMGKYRPLVDLMGHTHIGGKTLLYLIDGLYAGRHAVDTAPMKWNSSPFNGDWSSSLFLSQDQVAIDSVGFDFLWAEWPDYPHISGGDDYLHEAALVDNPPSGTFYDPDHSGNVTKLTSLGVHEHWNNPTDKQYSRNLGTGNGIELIAVLPDRAEKLTVVAPGAKVEKLTGGFNFTEGPAADADGNIFFCDIRSFNKIDDSQNIYKWSLAGKLSTFCQNSGGPGGLFFDKVGNLLACEHANRRLVAITPQGKVTVLADKYKNKPFNSPNDLWLDHKGGIYFTDPRYGNRDNMQQDGEHVYYLSPDRKTIIRVTQTLVRPNGLIGTPNGKLLYIADHGGNKTYVYTINDDGTLSNKKLFAPEGSDGMTIDNEGNIYLTTSAVAVYNSAGEKIETVEVPEWPANVCFGGRDKRILFITARTSLYSLAMSVKGL